MPRTFMEEGAGHYVSLLTNRVVFPDSPLPPPRPGGVPRPPPAPRGGGWRNNRPDVHVAFAVEHITKHRSGKSYADLLPLRVTGG